MHAYARADAFVLPTHSDKYGVVVAEGARGRQLVEEKYTWPAIAREVA